MTLLLILLFGPQQFLDEVRTLNRAAFVNVNLVDVEAGRILPRRTVYIEDGKIRSIGPAAETRLPEGTFEIDGAGKFLIPGLADMHVHHTGSGAFVTGTEPPMYEEQDLLLYLVNGVTTVRNMSGSSHDAGIKQKLANGEIAGPHYYSSGQPLTSVTRGLFVDTPQKAKEIITAQKSAGHDFVKVYCCFGDSRKEIYDQIIESSQANGIPAVGHIQLRLPLEDAFKLKSIEHLEHVPRYFNEEPPDIERHRDVINRMLESGTVVCPTLTPFDTYKLDDDSVLSEYLARPEMAYVSRWSYDDEMAAIRKRGRFYEDRKEASGIKSIFEMGMQYAYFLHRQGVPLILGSDTGGIFPLVPGFTIHRELELLNQAGLSPIDALRTGTVNVAKFLGNWETRGSIAENKESDLVLLDENPLVSISNTRRIGGVMIGKRWLDRNAISNVLQRLKKR